MLCNLKNAVVEDFETDNYNYGGCVTCDYGSEYINECTIATTNHRIEIKVVNMYEYQINVDFWVKLFCCNAQKILELTEDEFIEFLYESLGVIREENYGKRYDDDNYGVSMKVDGKEYKGE